MSVVAKGVFAPVSGGASDATTLGVARQGRSLFGKEWPTHYIHVRFLRALIYWRVSHVVGLGLSVYYKCMRSLLLLMATFLAWKSAMIRFFGSVLLV
jgi:hypothetical protein